MKPRSSHVPLSFIAVLSCVCAAVTGCGDGNDDGEDEGVRPLRSGTFVSRADFTASDAYARREKTLTIDTTAKTARITFKDDAGRTRVETYRIR